MKNEMTRIYLVETGTVEAYFNGSTHSIKNESRARMAWRNNSSLSMTNSDYSFISREGWKAFNEFYKEQDIVWFENEWGNCSHAVYMSHVDLPTEDVEDLNDDQLREYLCDHDFYPEVEHEYTIYDVFNKIEEEEEEE